MYKSAPQTPTGAILWIAPIDILTLSRWRKWSLCSMTGKDRKMPWQTCVCFLVQFWFTCLDSYNIVRCVKHIDPESFLSSSSSFWEHAFFRVRWTRYIVLHIQQDVFLPPVGPKNTLKHCQFSSFTSYQQYSNTYLNGSLWMFKPSNIGVVAFLSLLDQLLQNKRKSNRTNSNWKLLIKAGTAFFLFLFFFSKKPKHVKVACMLLWS